MKNYGFDSILSPKQCGSYKELSAQHSLMGMLKRFRESSERGDILGDFFSSLCKAFDCIDQNLIMIKLSLYGVIAKSINPIFFLFQKPDTRCQKKHEDIYGDPKNSMNIPGLFNINLINLFYKYEDDNINGFMDNNVLYFYAEDTSFVIIEIQVI